MTIDEVIEREQYSAEANREMADTYHTDENIYLKEEEAFRNREDYHRQLAEWLKELKKWRDFGDSIGRVLGKHFTKEELFKMMEVTADGDSN